MVLKKYAYLTVFLLMALSGCEKDGSQSEQYELLKHEFQGKYAWISSTSSSPVDLNMDGILSTDLFDELSQVNELEVEIKVLPNPRGNADFSATFATSWPEQTFTRNGAKTEVVTTYDPAVSVSYQVLPINAVCDVDWNSNHFMISSDKYTTSSRTSTLPESVSYKGITADREITVISRKSFYTSKGMVTTRVTSVFKRL